MQYDGTIDGDLFEKWLKEALCPELEAGSTIIMDNASFHRSKNVEQIASYFGHIVIFLPPYSPELNPIEHFWAVLEKCLQDLMNNACSLDEGLCIALQVE